MTARGDIEYRPDQLLWASVAKQQGSGHQAFPVRLSAGFSPPADPILAFLRRFGHTCFHVALSYCKRYRQEEELRVRL